MLGMLFAAFKKERSLEYTVKKIQEGDILLRNEVIQSFKPFIAKAVSAVCKRYISESDDEFSIGMIAFNEAIDKFTPEKGSSLLSFADTLVKRRVIDYLRSQSKNTELLIDVTAEDDEYSQSFIESEKSMQEFDKQNDSKKRKEEISLFQERLRAFNISFSDLVKHSPKHSDARKGAIGIAHILMEDPGLVDVVYKSKRLPIKQLEKVVKVSRKTIERNRIFIIAMLIILNEDFLYLGDYLKGAIDK
ncbi:RNA polymerase sigma factor SigI [Bacillus sp. MUM 13]|uniref:RNA polymerase sigma factor SigI n=1 Tax=Bacillus sp. MUM 13 TaxID=1678001 RepID=UPI0008F5A415|nr:RNA polymerase sigma factor SigI [Bacillus sp. MUM 13]OIK14504.1 RNA polymerase sigma-I factor [Bacillus sp. MUM 13]